MWKKILLVVLLVVVVALVSIPLWIDSAARSAVETAGTDALGVPTTLGGVDLSIFGGACAIEALQIDNPEGFETDYFFRLGKGSVAVDVGSVLEERVVVPSIVLEDVHLQFERDLKGTNYGTILRNIKKKEEEPEEEGATKWVLQEIVLKNVKVTSKELVAPAVSFTIPEIKLTNIGSETGGGIMLSKALAAVIKGTLRAVVETGKLGPELVKDLGAGLGKLAKTGVGTVVGTGGKVLDKVGGIFKKDDEEK